MRNSTLVYIEENDCYLMLLRNKKQVDENKNKWIGVGGKFEEGESPEECMLRETLEETGLTLTAYQYRGEITFVSDDWGTEYMHLFTATAYTGKLKECDEGELRWIPKEQIMDLNLWEGDKAFLPKIFNPGPFFTMRLQYRGDDLIKIESQDYPEEAAVREAYRALTKTLLAKGLTITTMESITAGLLASLITDTEGSSAVLKGAFVTYSNEAKMLQGVPKETLDTYTVYSEETAKAMASSCRKTYAANIGIGVTGTAGNVDPANKKASEPGKVYFAIDFDGKITAKNLFLSPMPNRNAYKMAVAGEICKELLSFF